MPERMLSIFSTLALLPATRMLLEKGSVCGWVYLMSFMVTLAYHASSEKEFRRTDHVLAYAVIAANTWMAWATKAPLVTVMGIGFVLLALVAYFDARLHPARYDRSHAVWHVLSGAAGYCFALGYA